MGLEITYTALATNIMAAYDNPVPPDNTDPNAIQYTPEQQMALMYSFATNIAVPIMPVDKLVGMIREQPKPNIKNPRPVLIPDEQRAERKDKSDLLRREVANDIYNALRTPKIYQDKYGTSFSRSSQRLFKQIPEGAAPGEVDRINEYNNNVSLLFPNDIKKRAENENKLCDKIMAEAPGTTREEALEQIREHRGQILINAIRELGDMPDRVMEMTDPNLPANELLENYKAFSWGKSLMMELENYIKETKGDNPLFKFTEDEFSFVSDKCRYINSFTAASNNILMVANPCYEFIDINALEDYNLPLLGGFDPNARDYKSYSYLAKESENREEWAAKRRRKDPRHYDKVYPNEGDNFVDLLGDAFFREGNSRTGIAEKVLINNFLSIEDTLFCETVPDENNATYKVKSEKFDSIVGSTLYSGNTPVAVEKNDRAVVMQSVNGTPTQVSPEVLFNYALKGRTDSLIKQMSSADPWYHTSSDAFKSMRKAFENVSKPAPLNPGENLNAAFTKYRELLNATNSYLETKKNPADDKWTKLHVNMANSLKNFAETKLKQLELIEKARITTKTFDNKKLSFEEKKSIAAGQDKVENDKNYIKELKNKDFINWLEDNFNRTVKSSIIPKTLVDAAKEAQQQLGVFEKIHSTNHIDIFDSPADMVHPHIGVMLGLMIAEKLIKYEQSLRHSTYAGPIEKMLSNPDKEQTKALLTDIANSAIFEKTGKNLGKKDGAKDSTVLTKDEFIKFAESFNSEYNITKTTERLYKEAGTSLFSEKLAGMLINSIKPLRKPGFNTFERFFRDTMKTNVIDVLNEHIKNGKDEPIPAEHTDNILTSVIMHSVIMSERSKEGVIDIGYYEKMLTEDAASVNKLRESIMELSNYKSLKARLTDKDGRLTTESLEKLTQIDMTSAAVKELVDKNALRIKYNAVRGKVTDRYPSDIKPIRGKEQDECEKAFAEFVKTNIHDVVNNLADNAIKNGTEKNAISALEARNLLRNCLFSELVGIERKLTGEKRVDYYESLLLDDNARYRFIMGDMVASEEISNLCDSFSSAENDTVDIDKMINIMTDTTLGDLAKKMRFHRLQAEAKGIDTAAENIMFVVNRDYLSSNVIFPIRDDHPKSLDDAENALINFTKTKVSDVIEKQIKNKHSQKEYFDAQTTKSIVSACVLNTLTQLERLSDSSNEAPGPLETAILKGEKTDSLCKNICSKPEYTAMMKNYITPDGKISIVKLYKLLDSNDIQNLAATLQEQAANLEAAPGEPKKEVSVPQNRSEIKNPDEMRKSVHGANQQKPKGPIA